jgi:gliding motility-associated protein GldL
MGLNNIVRTRGFRNFMAKLYGWGASVVILGALFKINHYPYADIMLIVGLGTESIIFFFSAFEPPHVEPDWSLVYPELAGMYHGDGTHKRPTEELDNLLSDAKIGPDLIESLGNGLRKMSDNAAKIADMTDAGVITSEYVGNLKNASSAAAELNVSYKTTAGALEGLAESAKALDFTSSDSQAYTGELKRISNNLSALNAAYELQLQATNAQVDSASKVQQTLNDYLQNLSDSNEKTAAYQQELDALTQRVAQLNKVYGNMLNAMGGQS